MENNRQKWVYLSFIAAAGLIGYLVFQLTWIVAGVWDFEARIPQFQWVVWGVSVLIALGSFLFLSLYDQSNQFMNEVVAELSRVTWPSVPDTRVATIAVLIMVIISGVALGLVDTLWTFAMKGVLNTVPQYIGWMF